MLDCLDQEITPDELAAAACYSRFHFSRLFMSMVGEPPIAMLRRLRLERAADRLSRANESILEVALDAGFASAEAFTRAFDKEFGVPPSRVRSIPFTPYLAAGSPIHFDTPHDALMSMMRQGDPTNMNIEVKEAPAMRLFALRHTGPYYLIGQTFGQLMGEGGRRGVPMNLTVALYYDDPGTTPEAELRSDACLLLAPGVEVEGLVKIDQPEPGNPHLVEVPAGRYAVGTYMGSYEGIGQAWNEFIGQVIPQAGLTIAEGVCFEMYMNNCMVTPVEQLRTDIYVPIA